ncbi:NAD(P)-dependent oxidoreductase [Thioalkalivibrio sp. ALE9]|uniref:NAD-dependent epimerase/dehydratase family protein n=1 Tax=Thioalkalivibrio sp. ALE9 TaxID=1158169 RepID=UPI000372BBB4|nr:hypothetical protein [Thioalkalivibrio sp. ALE9]
MNRVLITGASSAVAYYLVPRLQAGGFEPVVVGRNPPGFGGTVERCEIDLADPAQLARLPEAAALVHVAPIWLLPGLLPVLRERGVRRLVAFSSTSVQTKRDSQVPSERALARRLADSEGRVMQGALFARATILRPTLIWGGGRDQSISSIARFIERFGFFPVEGAASGMRQPVHADDLAAACLALLEFADRGTGVFEFAGGEVLSYREMVERVFEALGRPPRIVTLPRPALQWAVSAARVLPRFRGWTPAMVARMNLDMQFPSLHARAILGHEPRAFVPSREDLALE